MDFNKLIENGRKLDKFEMHKDEIEKSLEMELGLGGKRGADYTRTSYSETPILKHKENVGGLDFGDMLSLTELQENVRFEKMVLFKSYSTQTNRFDKYKADIIFTFVDRDGIEIKSSSWAKLDTSNQLSLTEKMKVLKGNVVWLEGRLVRKGERRFVDVIRVNECTADQNVAKQFFKKEVSGRQELIKKVWAEISKYPLANALYGQYEQVITSTPIKEVYEREGGYLYYLNLLVELVSKTPLETEVKDKVLSYDIITQLKSFVNGLELTKVIHHLAVSKYNNEDGDEIINDALFKSYSDPSIYEVINKDLRRGISSLILLEDWSKWGMNYVYSNIHKTVVAVKREG